MNKEKWIDEVLQSAKGMKPAEANPFLHTRIETKLQQEKPVQSISLRWVYASLAGLFLLLLLNISVWRNSAKGNQDTVKEQLAQEFSWASNSRYSLNY